MLQYGRWSGRFYTWAPGPWIGAPRRHWDWRSAGSLDSGWVGAIGHAVALSARPLGALKCANRGAGAKLVKIAAGTQPDSRQPSCGSDAAMSWMCQGPSLLRSDQRRAPCSRVTRERGPRAFV